MPRRNLRTLLEDRRLIPQREPEAGRCHALLAGLRQPPNRYGDPGLCRRTLMMRIVRNDRGATLTEQLVALLLGSVMITGLYGFYRSELFHHISQETKIATLEDARGALEIMVWDLKNAGSCGTGSAPPERGGVDDPDNEADTVRNRRYAGTGPVSQVQTDLYRSGRCADAEAGQGCGVEVRG